MLSLSGEAATSSTTLSHFLSMPQPTNYVTSLARNESEQLWYSLQLLSDIISVPQNSVTVSGAVKPAFNCSDTSSILTPRNVSTRHGRAAANVDTPSVQSPPGEAHVLKKSKIHLLGNFFLKANFVDIETTHPRHPYTFLAVLHAHLEDGRSRSTVALVQCSPIQDWDC